MGSNSSSCRNDLDLKEIIYPFHTSTPPNHTPRESKLLLYPISWLTHSWMGSNSGSYRNNLDLNNLLLPNPPTTTHPARVHFFFFVELKFFSRRHIGIFLFFLFSPKTGFDNSCKLSPTETICTKCQILLSGKNKKTMINLSSAELAHRVVKVKSN